MRFSEFYLKYLRPINRTHMVIAGDYIAAFLAAPLALALGHVSMDVTNNLLPTMFMWLSVLCIIAIVFPKFRLYSSLWRFASTSDFLNIAAAVTVTCAIFYLLNLALSTVNLVPSLDGRAFIIYWLILSVFVGVSRLAYRQLSDRVFRTSRSRIGKSAIFVGTVFEASTAMKQLEFQSSDKTPPIGVIIATDDGELDGQYLSGVIVKRDTQKLSEIIAESANSAIPITHMIIGASGFENEEARIEMIRQARAAGLHVKAFRGLSDLHTNGPSRLFREVDVLSLLQRKQNVPDEETLASIVTNKRIMVTGGAGSIGSQLARRCLSLGAAEVVIVDRSEPGMFRWLSGLNDEQRARSRGRIADVSDRPIMSRLFQELRPDIVFHAAALKHVPLVETNWASAVVTNILGTWVCASLSNIHGVERFVFISTDKAADPTTFLGHSKRMGELICGTLNTENSNNSKALDKGRSSTVFTSVRFGNVFRSDGSVVNIFEGQIQAGGPVTITDPKMKRYFMTAREASDLVILSAAIDAKKKDNLSYIYVLEMGEQIKIIDIANIMIRLAGHTPDGDIKIVTTGVREFEKLEEKLVGQTEKTTSTENESVIAALCPAVPYTVLEKSISQLQQTTMDGDLDDAVAIIRALETSADSSDADIIQLPVKKR